MRRILNAILMLAIVALPASAATLKLKNGTTIDAKVKSYDTATQTLYVTKSDGTDGQYKMDDLDGRTVYLVNASRVPKDDAKAMFQVANFARDAGLYAHAMRRYNETIKLDPSMKPTVDVEVKKLKRTAAELCARNARAAVAKNDMREAEKWLNILVEKLPDEPEAEQARSILETHYAKAREAKVAAADAKADASLQKDVEKGKQRFAQMVDKTKRGLQAKSNSEAKNLFAGAIADGKAVQKMIDDVEDKYGDKVKEQVQGYRQVVDQQMVDVYLHIANALATQTDYNGAQRQVNDALAIDSKNEAALTMRARIQEYASQGWGWRWQ
jgi:tetratricopeptide (TPR) repeat protein